MNARKPPSVDSIASFIAIVERDRDERSAKIVSDAEERGRELCRQARREAKERVALAARDDRARSGNRVEAARAELATHERQLAHEVAKALLERGSKRLVSELARRWTDPELRGRWLSAAVADAAALLPRGAWSVEHPPSLSEGEALELARAAERASGAKAELKASSELVAGIRLHSGGATLDATLEGLLVSRASVEGRLLVEVSRRKGTRP